MEEDSLGESEATQLPNVDRSRQGVVPEFRPRHLLTPLVRKMRVVGALKLPALWTSSPGDPGEMGYVLSFPQE